ncbi:MAG: helix-turn-helix transcriptional regulator [Bacteroidia bacterium]
MDEHSGIFLMMLGKNIARLRKERGISQVQMANEMEMDRSNLRRIEAGRTNPTTITLHRISRVLDIKFEELFDFKEKK